MVERYYVGAYWGPRRESAEECARRLGHLLQALAPVDLLFARWFQSARTFKQSLQRPLGTEPAALQTYLERNALRDDRRALMEGGGFQVWLWNGGSGGEKVWLQGWCGLGPRPGGNHSLVELPHSGPQVERLLSTPVLMQVLRCMAMAWEPDWGVVMSSAHEELTEAQGERGVSVGWVTYLSRSLGAVPPLPAPVRVEPVEERGTLVTLTPERFTASNPEHVARATRVHALLDEAGLLGPMKR